MESAERKALVRGVLTILGTVLAMALADALIKHSSSGMTLWQVWVLRSVLVVPVLVALARNNLRTLWLGWVMLRSLILVLMYLGIYGAIPFLDLSVIAAALYTAPLFIVALSALVLREPVNRWQWIAILLGFAGAMLIVRPLTAAFSPLTLLPMAAALLYAMAAVLTRARCADVPATAMALSLNLMLLLVGSGVSALIALSGPLAAATANPFLFGHWQGMDAGDWQLVAGLAVLMIGIGIGFARAYQRPRPQVIATFDYAYLIFASFWGYAFFGEVPGHPTLAGMALIALAGALGLWAGGRTSKKDTV
jgi:drug/metabolite transporter (DMT)-like permease